YVGDLNTTSRATASSRGFAALLEQPTKTRASKLCWKEIGALERDVLLLPKKIDFELPGELMIDLREFAVRKDRQLARYRTEVRESYELGYVFGTFLGDGTAFRAMSRNSEIGRVSWAFGPKEEDVAAKLIRCLQAIAGVEVKPTPSEKVIHV